MLPRDQSRPAKLAQRSVHTRGTDRGVLWSASTAREIVTVIAEDVENGLLGRAEAMDLIDRVRARAGPVQDNPDQPTLGIHHSPT